MFYDQFRQKTAKNAGIDGQSLSLRFSDTGTRKMPLVLAALEVEDTCFAQRFAIIALMIT